MKRRSIKRIRKALLSAIIEKRQQLFLQKEII